jgi:galactonate dehydratase
MNRRDFLHTIAISALLPNLAFAAPKLKITGFELLPVRATERTVWLFVKLKTDVGIIGWGEASDAFGFSNTSKQDAARMESELRKFFTLVEGKSPLQIEAYRQQGEPLARNGLPAATAYSAIEQALWDLAGKALGVPAHALFGGKVRDRLSVYANINRTTKPRTPEGFAATARRAVAQGFRSVKAAPFDGFPKPGSAPDAIKTHVDQGIACVAAIREATGPEVEVLIDCHSFFDVAMARDVARRLEAQRLGWYEEPVAPTKTEETLAIRQSIRQPMAGGEILFGVSGFAPLCRTRAVHVIMPDVKHCGGLKEMTHIAAMAAADGVEVAPHNPSGPIATAASVQACAGMKNFRILELQWGEVAWRSDLVTPPETFESGSIGVPEKPGFGVELNEKLAQAHPL